MTSFLMWPFVVLRLAHLSILISVVYSFVLSVLVYTMDSCRDRQNGGADVLLKSEYLADMNVNVSHLFGPETYR